jgi:LPS export ABC transporter protein LptC
MMKIPKKYLPLAGIVILFMVLGYFLVKTPGRKVINKKAINELPLDAGITGSNLHLVEEREEEGYKFILDADKAISSQNEERVTMTGIRLRFERKDGHNMEIKGAEGNFDKGLNEISLKGGVQGQSNDGYSLSTEYVVYNQKEGVLKTDEPVKMSGPFFSVSGRGLLFSPEGETLKIISGVTTIVNIKEGL